MPLSYLPSSDSPRTYPHIITRMSPSALGIQVSQVQSLLQSLLNPSHSACNLASHKGWASTRRFVIKEDAIDQKHVVGLTIIDEHPVGVLLGDACVCVCVRVCWAGGLIPDTAFYG